MIHQLLITFLLLILLFLIVLPDKIKDLNDYIFNIHHNQHLINVTNDFIDNATKENLKQKINGWGTSYIFLYIATKPNDPTYEFKCKFEFIHHTNPKTYYKSEYELVVGQNTASIKNWEAKQLFKKIEKKYQSINNNGQ